MVIKTTLLPSSTAQSMLRQRVLPNSQKSKFYVLSVDMPSSIVLRFRAINTLPAARRCPSSVITLISSHSRHRQRCIQHRLILGRISLAEQQQRVAIPSAPVNVAFTVSRSSGVTLDIKIGENSSRQEIGELVPLDEVDISSLSRTGEACFTFSSRDNAHIPRNAQIAKSLSSEATFSLAREWLAQCLENHPRCTKAARLAVGRPLRLVDVGDNHGTDPKIVIMDPSEPSPVYLTLSHCWGGATILRLLLQNVDPLTTGIPMGDLPKTFLDAVIITRRLG